MNTFFTSDTHFGHANIIKYCFRPFQTLEEMDNTLIENWNRVVGKRDTVYHLGDFCYGNRLIDFNSYFMRLNGKITFIKGNHDKIAWSNRNWFEAAYDSYHECSVNGQTIILCHYALRVWKGNHRGSWHLYGHSHGSIADDPESKSFDVGVDCHKFTPVSFDEVAAIMAKKTFKPVDHHKPREVEILEPK